MIDFQIRKRADGTATVELRGHLQQTHCEYFFNCMEDLIEEGFRYVVIDCTGLGQISSFALGRLVRARHSAVADGGKLYLTGINSGVADVLSFTGLNRLFGIYPAVEDALSRIVAVRKRMLWGLLERPEAVDRPVRIS